MDNKGPDQLHGCLEADLRLCLRINKTLVLSRCGSCVPLVIAYPKSRFWNDKAHIVKRDKKGISSHYSM